MKRLAFLIVMILALAGLTASLFAGENNDTKCKKDKLLNCNAIATFKMGISSENPGVRRSAIYYAGEYKLTELTPALIKQLKKEDDRTVRILIALSLYKMGNSEGARTVNKMADNDQDLKVRRICTALSEEIMTGAYQMELAKLTGR